MKEQEREGRPQGELTAPRRGKGQEPAESRQGSRVDTELVPLMKEGFTRPGMSHEGLVAGFKSFISHWQERLYRDHRESFSPLQIIRTKLGWYKDLADDQTRAHAAPIAMAWDVLAYEHYEPGSAAESSAGLDVAMHYQMTKESTIKLSETQMKVIHALTEAAGIPYQPGQSEIEIPDKLKNFFQWMFSEERFAKIAQAQREKKWR